MRAAAEKAIPVVEPAADRALLQLRPEVPLAVGGARVARRLEKAWENLFRLRHAATTVAPGIDARALLVATGEQPRAGRRANIPRNIALAEPHAFAGESIHVGSCDLFRVLRIEADVGVALVVGENHHNIGRTRSGRVRIDWREQSRAKK